MLLPFNIYIYMYIQCIHEMSTAFSCPSGRGNFDGQEFLATPLRLPRRSYKALVVYIYIHIYILATGNTCMASFSLLDSRVGSR